MRINKYVALATGMSRRAADRALSEGTITVNGTPAKIGQPVTEMDIVALHGKKLTLDPSAPRVFTTIMLNKPPGYVVSRNGQGSPTIYDLLPAAYHMLKPVGRLDKGSSGLLLLTNDGQLAYDLTHPSRQKTKVYEVALDKPLQNAHRLQISEHGVTLEDGLSKLELDRLSNDKNWRVTMYEGRNRQIRRTFAALGYTVTKLHRVQFGSCALNDLPSGSSKTISEL